MMAAFVEVEETPLVKLEYKVRDLKIKRQEDYIWFQTKLNEWKKLYVNLEDQITSLEEEIRQKEDIIDHLEGALKDAEEEISALNRELRSKNASENMRSMAEELAIYKEWMPKIQEKVQQVADRNDSHRRDRLQDSIMGIFQADLHQEAWQCEEGLMGTSK
ncbi:hypothetical protein NLJ89_g8879 [Agrocybe chaxingu]|uniref:Uncharacterized protein n=1 Tax=Agrocybe chaxingu TaxID=84603 RepID=A0A9W8JUD3_9AGAR|nr:hypothetical protein NLJ89_g8879 [Agrocybe chaxingu]